MKSRIGIVSHRRAHARQQWRVESLGGGADNNNDDTIISFISLYEIQYTQSHNTSEVPENCADFPSLAWQESFTDLSEIRIVTKLLFCLLLALLMNQSTRSNYLKFVHFLLELPCLSYDTRHICHSTHSLVIRISRAAGRIFQYICKISASL